MMKKIIQIGYLQKKMNKVLFLRNLMRRKKRGKQGDWLRGMKGQRY